MKIANAMALITFLAISVGLAIWGFSVAGTPSTQAAMHRDMRRVSYMMRTADTIYSTAKPATSQPVKKISDGLIKVARNAVPEPEDDAISIEVRRIDDKHFEICTTFEVSSKRWHQAGFRIDDEKLVHDGGRYCRTFSLDEPRPDSYTGYYYWDY